MPDSPPESPQETAETTTVDIKKQVEDVIEMIRPALQMDGGDIALVDIDDDSNVHVELHGACVGCPASLMTLKAGVERILKDRIPEVNEVLTLQ